MPFAAAAASSSAAASAVSLYSSADDSFDVSFSRQLHSDMQPSHFAQSLSEQNAQLERQRRLHRERMAEAERVHPALPPARPYTAAPVPLLVPSQPVSRYLRPEDDPDEDVQVSSDDETEEEVRRQQREPERRRETQRESLSPESELRSARNRELPNYARPTRQERRRRSSTSRSPALTRTASRPRPRSRSRTRSPPQSPLQQQASKPNPGRRDDSSPPRLSSLSRVYDLLGENQQFYESRTQRDAQPTAHTRADPSSPRQLVQNTIKHLTRDSDDSATHVHVHMHPSPRPDRNDDSVSTVPVQSASTQKRSVSGQGESEPPPVAAALPETQNSALKPEAAAEPAVQQKPSSAPSHSDSALGMSDLSDSGLQQQQQPSKLQPRAQAPVVEDESAPEDERENFPNFAAGAPALSRAQPPQSMMAITRAPIGSSARVGAPDVSSDNSVASSLRTLKNRKSKPLTPYEPSSSYRRPGPGGAAGGTASDFTVISGASTTSAAVTNPQAQGSDVGIFMPSSSSSAASSANKLALNSTRAAKDKTKITGHTAAVIARLHSVARAPPKPSQCAISLLGSKAAAEIAQETAAMHAAHSHALHLHEPNPSPPPTHPARASPLKSRQVKHTVISGPTASAAATKPVSATAAPAPLRVNQQPAPSGDSVLPTPSPLPQLTRQPSQQPQPPPALSAQQPQPQQLIRRASVQQAQPSRDTEDHLTPPSQPDPAMLDLMRQLTILQAASQHSTAATSAVVSAATTPRVAAAEENEDRDVILEPRMKDAASSPSRFTFERELRPSMHQRSASAMPTTTAPPPASSGRPPLMRSASLPHSPPPAQLESGRPSGRSSPAPDEQKQQPPSLHRVSTVRSHEASTASSRAVSRQPSRSVSRGRSPSASPRKAAASGASTARSPRSLSSPRSDVKGPSIRPALCRNHSRSSSWLPNAAEPAVAQPTQSKSPRASPAKPQLVRSASVGASRAPSADSTIARQINPGLESWSQPPSSVRSHAGGIGNGYLLEVDEDDESQPNSARSTGPRSQPISVAPAPAQTPRSAMRTTAVPAAATAPTTAAAAAAPSSDVLSQVSTALVQSLLAMGLQQDARSRELAQNLLVGIASGQRSAVTSAAATPLLTQTGSAPSTFVPPPQLPGQGAQQPSAVRPTMHHRRQSSVTFAGYPAPADLTPSPVPSDGEDASTFVFPDAPQGRRGSASDVARVASSLAPTAAFYAPPPVSAPAAAPAPVPASLLQPPPHAMNDLLESSSRTLSRLVAPSASVLAPTQSTLLRERTLVQAQQLLSTKTRSTAPVVIMKRKKIAIDDEAAAAGPASASTIPPSRSATAASLSLHRCQSLRRVRNQQPSIDSIHQEQLAMLWGEMRTLRVQIAKLHREIEEDALYHLYLKKKYTQEAAGAEAGESSEASAPLDHDALISEVGTLELDPDLFLRNPTLQSLQRQERLLLMHLCFICLGHASACAKLRRASADSIDAQVTLARAAAGFKEWKLIAQRVPCSGGSTRRQRGIASHSEAREHMELWKQIRAVRKWTAIGSRAAVMRDKLAALLAMRSARAQSALYHCWRARVLALYRERMQHAMAAAFCDRMRCARDFRAWRMRASRERFLYWQLQRAMETQAARRALEPAPTVPPLLLPAPTAAPPQKENKGGFKRSTVTSIAKQRIAAIQVQVQQRKAKAIKAPSVAPRKTAVAAGAGPVGASSAAPLAPALPSGLSPLDELAALEAESPALSKYFLAEVRRELLAAADGRAMPAETVAQLPAATDSTVAVAQALERVRAASGASIASASSASSLWLRVLAHAFRSQDAPFHLEQIRWIESQLKLRLEQEASIGWIIRKYHAQLEQRAEAEEVAVIRRRVESERNNALREVSKPTAEFQRLQSQAARIVPVPAQVAAAPAPVASFASGPPVYSHSVRSSPVKANRASVDLSASSPASPLQSRTMPAHSPVRAPIALLMDRDATAPLSTDPDRPQSPVRPQAHTQQPTSPLMERARLELLDRQAKANEEWEHEQALRERAALQEEWIASHMHRGTSSRDASASSSVAEDEDARSLSRVDESDLASTGDSSVHAGAAADSASTANASVREWLRQYDLPDPDEAEAEVAALMHDQQLRTDQTTDSAANDESQQEDAESDGDMPRHAAGAHADDSHAMGRPADSSAVSVLHSTAVEQHLHVHHFSSALASHSDRSMLVSAALPSATVDRIETRLDSLQSSVDGLQHSLSESFYRQQQQEMYEAREQLPSEAQWKNDSSMRPSQNTHRNAAILPLQLRSPARSSRPLPLESPGSPASPFPLHPDPLRSRANIFWAVSTYGKVFRAWLTRALLRHLERKANQKPENMETSQQSDTEERSAVHSQSLRSPAAASSDPELTEALSEPSSFAVAGPSMSASSSDAASFHSSRSGRPIDPALLQPVYPELLSQPAVKHVLEESILEAERLEESMEHSRQSLETPVRDRVRFAPTPRSAETGAPAEASLDELMFARFKRSTDRKAQLQLERILLKTPPTGVASAVVAPPRQPTSAGHASSSTAASVAPVPSSVLRPSDLRDLLARSLESSKQALRDTDTDRGDVREPSTAAAAAPIRRPSVVPPSAFAAMPPAPSATPAPAASSSSGPPSVTLAAFTDLSFTPGSSFGFASNLPSFQTSMVGGDASTDASAIASGTQLHVAPASLPSSSPDPAVSAYVAAASSSSYHPPPRPLPRLAVQFGANKPKLQSR